MNIGSLYLVKKRHWLLVETTDITAPKEAFYRIGIDTSFMCSESWNLPDEEPIDEEPIVEISSKLWSFQLNSEVTYFSPKTYLVFLDQDGDYKKVLTSDGRIGWILCYSKQFNDCFEEASKE